MSSKLPVDAVVQKTLTTIQKHEELLHKIDRATRNTTSDAETHFRPIHIAMEPCERVYPQDMIVVGDNEHLRKVLIVLVFLCDEIHALQAIAANKFYPLLVMFGLSPIEIDSKDGDISDSAAYLKYPGNRERLVGLFMPTLQELANFVDRCHAVVLNLVQQLSSSYHNQGSGSLLGSLMGSQPTQPALIAHLFSAVQALGDILVVLVTLDHLVTQNEFLKESWAAFKGMIVYARADPMSFQTSDAHTTGTLSSHSTQHPYSMVQPSHSISLVYSIGLLLFDFLLLSDKLYLLVTHEIPLTHCTPLIDQPYHSTHPPTQKLYPTHSPTHPLPPPPPPQSSSVCS